MGRGKNEGGGENSKQLSENKKTKMEERKGGRRREGMIIRRWEERMRGKGWKRK